MTIDDELLLELLKPEKSGKVGKDALIVKVVGTLKVDYKLEKSEDYQTKADAFERTWSIMTPDILVTTQGT
jgi:hypothetical protein